MWMKGSSMPLIESDTIQESFFMVARLEDFVPGDRRLGEILELFNDVLGRLDELFDTIHAASWA
jgi:hypothetical protein